jgi:thioredoxin-related protein
MIRLLALLFAFALAPALAAEPWERFFTKGLGDFREELADARAAGRKGVVFIYQMEGCEYCDRMKARVLSRPDVQSWFGKRFAAYSIDILGSTEMTDFAGRKHTEKGYAREALVQGMPTLDFFDLEGRLIARVPGEIPDSRTFIALGDWIASGAHAKESFDQFRARRGLSTVPLKINRKIPPGSPS